MGPKRADNTNKNRRVSQLIVAPTEEQGFLVHFSFTLYADTCVLAIENYQCLGRFAADLEVCCRELFSRSPYLTIPVYNRNLPSSVSQHMGTYSGASAVPSLIGGEEQLSSSAKLPFTARIPSNSGTLTGIETDNQSHSILGKSIKSRRSNDEIEDTFSLKGRESIRSSSSSYRTFHLVSNSDFYRPKFLADPVGHEQDPIDQIKTLYMRGISFHSV